MSQPIETMLIDLKTRSGDLDKTLKDLNKLSDLMRGMRGAGSMHLEEVLTDAIKRAMKGIKIRGGGASDLSDLKETLDNFSKDTRSWLKEIKTMFGTGSNFGATQIQAMTRRTGLSPGEIYEKFTTSAALKTVMPQLIEKFGGDEKKIRDMLSVAMFSHMFSSITGRGKFTAENLDIAQFFKGTPEELAGSQAFTTRLMRLMTNAPSENFFKSKLAIALKKETGENVKREIGFWPVNPDNPDQAQAMKDLYSMAPDLAEAMGIGKGGAAKGKYLPAIGPSNISKWKGGLGFDAQEVKDAYRAVPKDKKKDVNNLLKMMSNWGDSKSGKEIADFALTTGQFGALEGMGEVADVPGVSASEVRKRWEEWKASGKDIMGEAKKGPFTGAEMKKQIATRQYPFLAMAASFDPEAAAAIHNAGGIAWISNLLSETMENIDPAKLAEIKSKIKPAALTAAGTGQGVTTNEDMRRIIDGMGDIKDMIYSLLTGAFSGAPKDDDESDLNDDLGDT